MSLLFGRGCHRCKEHFCGGVGNTVLLLRDGWVSMPSVLMGPGPGPQHPSSATSHEGLSVFVLSDVRDQLTTPLSSEHQRFPGLSKSIFPGSSAKGFLLGNAGWHYHCPLSFILRSGWWCRPGCSWKPEGRREGWQHPLPPVSEAGVVLHISSDCAPR